MFLLRITDGNEVKATLTLYDRKTTRNAVVLLDAENGGGWGGRQDEVVCDLDSVPTDITAETTVKLPDAYVVKANKWKGGTIKFSETGTSYTIVSNTAGNGVAGAVVTVTADSTMLTDYASGTDKEVILQHDQTDTWGRERKLAAVVKNGQVDPATEWGLDIYLNDEIVRSYPDLSSDPNSAKYFVNVINQDTANFYVRATDLWTGAITASVRPANQFGVIPAAGVAAKVLTLAATIVDLSAANSSTIASFTFGADVVPDTYTLTRGATDWTVTSVKQAHHTFPQASDAVAYTADNSLSIGFTIGGTPASGDVITVRVEVLRTSDAVGGKVYPDVVNAPNEYYVITANDETTVTITTGDLTTSGAAGDSYMIEYQQEFGQGYDGLGALTEQPYLDAFDTATSLLNRTVNQGYGIIKIATPGVTEVSGVNSVLVQQAGVAYADNKNHQFRYEVPKSTTTDVTGRDYVNNTLGRSNYAKVAFPSYVKVADPILTGLLKDVPATGMIHGWEAKTAKDWGGYHKAAAGMALSRIRELPTGNVVLNGELLNGAGIQRIEKRKGKFVLWGGRLPAVDSTYRFANHREQLSYYGHVLSESFDHIIFALNDPSEWARVKAEMKSFFYPEWKNRALQGNSFDEAALIKVDAENNTAATSAAGDLNADVKLWLADMVERLVITLGQRGIYESTAA